MPPENSWGYWPARVGADADALEQLAHARAHGGAVRLGVVQADGVADLARDALHGVERVERALEDERDLVPAQVAHAALAAPLHVHDAPLGREVDRPGDPVAGPGPSSCRIESAVVVLPQPDSPAIPSASPRRSSNDTPETISTSAAPAR